MMGVRWMAGFLEDRSRETAFSQAAANHFARICRFLGLDVDLPALITLSFVFIMVQGKTKGLTMKGPNTRAAKKAAANTKKGSRTIAPKKAPLVKQAKMQQVSSAFVSAHTGAAAN